MTLPDDLKSYRAPRTLSIDTACVLIALAILLGMAAEALLRECSC